MRKSAIIGAALAAATAMTLTGVVTASADEASQEVNFTISPLAAGGLSVSTGGPISTLGLAAQNADATGSLTLFGVTDTRGTKDGWTATLALTDFVNQDDNAVVVPATNATYTPGPAAGIVWGGQATPPSSSIALKNDATPVMVRTDRNSNASLEVVSWTNVNALTVDMPAGVPVGQYKATLTLSAY